MNYFLGKCITPPARRCRKSEWTNNLKSNHRSHFKSTGPQSLNIVSYKKFLRNKTFACIIKYLEHRKKGNISVHFKD